MGILQGFLKIAWAEPSLFLIGRASPSKKEEKKATTQ
jgi:hypothetical protein